MVVNVTHTHQVDMTVSTTAYTDGDVVGGLLDMNILCGGGGGGIIRQIRLADAANQSEPYYLYLFDKKPTAIADGDAFATAIVISDVKALVARVSIAALDYVVLNSFGYVLKDDLYISHGTGQLWGYLVANGSTPDYIAATDLTLTLVGWKD